MSEKIQNFTVQEAEDKHLEGAIEALAQAFAMDPVMSKAIGGVNRIEKVRELFQFQVDSTYRPRGKVDVAVDSDGTVLGAALWLSPQAQKGHLLADIKSLPEYMKILGTSLIRGIFTELKLLNARPKFDHWYLYTIGVHESARSRGVGAALLDYRRDKLDGYPAYLEASTFRSAALYRRHGFVELGEFKGGKPAVGMWLPASKSLIDTALNKN